MDHFDYRNGLLHAESIALPDIAAVVKTPFYCYSRATLVRHYRVFAEGLSGLDIQICYAVKANSNLAVLRTLAQEGSGADVVSEGEIRRALAAGITAGHIVFSGVGKSRAEMAYALEQGVWQFNVESEPELDALSEVAASQNQTARIAIRINPDVDAGTHEKISTGKKDNKFGVGIDQAFALYERARTLPGITVQGVSMHIGSQLTSLDPFRAAYTHAKSFVQALRANGHTISVLDIGGGLGVPYEQDAAPPPDPKAYGALVRDILGDIGCKLVFEPGRLLVANAGILVSEVIYVKQGEQKQFLVLDAAMNDLVRPAMYGAHHDLVPVKQPAKKTPLQPYDIVGPVCETGDTFSRDRMLPPIAAGALVAFRTAGAYGAAMSNNYNTRLLVPEVLVDDHRYAIIRPRSDYDELLARERIPEWLKPHAA